MSKILLALGTLLALNAVALAEPTYSANPSQWVSPRVTDQAISPSLSSNVDATTTFSIGAPVSNSSENRSSTDGFRSPTAHRIGDSSRQ